MFLGKALRVFAATLVFSSSISFATGEGTGPNTTNAPAGAQQIPLPLVIHTNEFSKTLPNGDVETITVETATANTAEEVKATETLVTERLKESAIAGGFPNLLEVNPHHDVKDEIVDEDLVPPEFQRRINRGKINLPEPPSYVRKIQQFGKGYWTDFKNFPKTQMTMTNFTVSVIRTALNSGLLFTTAVYCSGADNITPHQALVTNLIYGAMSGGISYISKLLPWNRPLPLPADTTFWRSVESLIKLNFWIGTEVGFLQVGRLSMTHENNMAISRGEHAPYKVGTFKDVLITTVNGTEAQAPYEIGFGHQYVVGMEKTNKLLEEQPEMAKQVKAAQDKLYKWLIIKNTAISVLTNTIAMGQMKGWSFSHIGFEFLYAGAAIITIVVWDIPGKISTIYQRAKTYLKEQDDSSLPIPQECEGALASLPTLPKE